ncbi:M56 family metallopeptidase [Roseateles sp.]|uniref:M56 family metallopeptidase n=1 Tax=Roseateles sp. TaxID=1971397 RepID=UPI003267D69E
MIDTLLAALQRQALLLSLGTLLLLPLRPLLLKRLGARATYAAWLLLPALLATPLLPSLSAKPLPVLVTVAEMARTATAPLLIPPQTGALWPQLLLAAWLAGTALVLTLQAARQWRLSRHGTRLPAGASPALVGLLRPLVALPADFETRFTPEERRLILAHEDVHRTRHDNAWNLLTCLLTALHWWNPLAWLAARRMQADQELACDAAVLASRPQALADYTRALLAAHDLTPHGAPLASRWGSTHPLIERIAMLNRPAPLQRRRNTALGLALLAVVGLAYAAQGVAPDTIDTTRKVDIRMVIASGDAKAQPRLIVTLGAPARIEWGANPDEVWRMDMTVTQDADGLLKVVTDSSYRGEKLGNHISHIASGDTQGLSIGPDGGPLLNVSRVVTLLPADFKPSH